MRFKRASTSAWYIAARDKAVPLYMCRVVLLLLRHCRGAAGLGTTMKYLRCTTSGAAKNGLGSTMK
jgi:hypothetical protein